MRIPASICISFGSNFSAEKAHIILKIGVGFRYFEVFLRHEFLLPKKTYEILKKVAEWDFVEATFLLAFFRPPTAPKTSRDNGEMPLLGSLLECANLFIKKGGSGCARLVPL